MNVLNAGWNHSEQYFVALSRSWTAQFHIPNVGNDSHVILKNSGNSTRLCQEYACLI